MNIPNNSGTKEKCKTSSRSMGLYKTLQQVGGPLPDMQYHLRNAHFKLYNNVTWRDTKISPLSEGVKMYEFLSDV